MCQIFPISLLLRNQRYVIISKNELVLIIKEKRRKFLKPFKLILMIVIILIVIIIMMIMIMILMVIIIMMIMIMILMVITIMMITILILIIIMMTSIIDKSNWNHRCLEKFFMKESLEGMRVINKIIKQLFIYQSMKCQVSTIIKYELKILKGKRRTMCQIRLFY